MNWGPLLHACKTSKADLIALSRSHKWPQDRCTSHPISKYETSSCLASWFVVCDLSLDIAPNSIYGIPSTPQLHAKYIVQPCSLSWMAILRIGQSLCKKIIRGNVGLWDKFNEDVGDRRLPSVHPMVQNTSSGHPIDIHMKSKLGQTEYIELFHFDQ